MVLEQVWVVLVEVGVAELELAEVLVVYLPQQYLRAVLLVMKFIVLRIDQ
jgi:hypothetical protein